MQIQLLASLLSRPGQRQRQQHPLDYMASNHFMDILLALTLSPSI